MIILNKSFRNLPASSEAGIAINIKIKLGVTVQAITSFELLALNFIGIQSGTGILPEIRISGEPHPDQLVHKLTRFALIQLF